MGFRGFEFNGAGFSFWHAHTSPSSMNLNRALTSLLMALFVLNAAAQNEDMPRNQKAESAELTYTKSVTLRYLLFTPKDYEQDKNKKWPLMVFLHGAGERGTNLAKVGVHGPPKVVASRPDFPFVLISPQCPTGQTWQKEAINALIDEAIKKYRVDTDRIYLTGLSMGGFGTWAMAASYPERFAAVVPICGGGNVIEVLLPAKGKEAALKTLPIWAFHGGKDPVVKVEESERMIDAFKKAGNNNVKLTIYPEAEHDSWTETYNNEEVYKWLLEHTKSQRSQGAK
jgi:predicted peptidase